MKIRNFFLRIYIFSLYFRKSVTSFFATYDALSEDGTATPVCKALDEVSDISIPGKVESRLRMQLLLIFVAVLLCLSVML